LIHGLTHLTEVKQFADGPIDGWFVLFYALIIGFFYAASRGSEP
jgi:hypothetical protein